MKTQEIQSIVDITLRKQLHEYNPEYKDWVDELCNGILERINILDCMNECSSDKLHIWRTDDERFQVNLSSKKRPEAWHIFTSPEPMDALVNMFSCK